MALSLGKKRRERNIYLPWERRSIWTALGLPGRRFRSWALIGLVGLALYGLRARDQRETRERVTRATLRHTREAIESFRADHNGRCPKDLVELTLPSTGPMDKAAYLTRLPSDVWRRPIRYACPGTNPGRPYDLLSDGPDGEPYGLDRIDY